MLDEPWVAIDDIPLHFPADAPVIITNPHKGFDKNAAKKLEYFLNIGKLPKEDIIEPKAIDRYDMTH